MTARGDGRCARRAGLRADAGTFAAPPALALGLSLALAACSTLAGCSRATPEQRFSEGEDPLGRRTATTETSLGMQPSEARADLMRADALWRNGDFAEALPIYRRIYAQRFLEPDLRARAAFAWAELEGNLLNPRRDLDAAIARLESFLEEFPESSLVPEAEASLLRLRALRLRERAARSDSLPEP
ncbi:MAG: hypothetical protein R6X25_05545 [Candidatus Krumholzibacteriia bacterium]